MDRHFNIIYGTAGNHETHPTNAFQPSSVGNTSHWIYSLLSDVWTRWIGSESATDAERIGAFSTRYPRGNLRVISLNTNLYYRSNFWLYQNIMLRDPSGQIDWLVQELDAAEKAGENVYIIGHLPFGNRNTFHDQSNYIDQIMNRYSGTIAAMFFGHTHKDHFQISYADHTDKNFYNALVTSYIGPSLTPTSGMPSFRVYDVDPVTFAVLDATTYTADMNSPTYQTQGPVWEKHYSAKEVYGSLLSPPLVDPHAELTAAFWHNVTQVLEGDDKAFDEYMLRKSRGWNQPDCDDKCKETEICDLRASRSEDNCDAPSIGSLYIQRKENPSERDECGISVLQATLSSLVVNKGLLRLLQKMLETDGVELSV